MPFPYPPDPGDDLRELFRRSKQRDTVRDLGRTSMTRGDGMIELRDQNGLLIGGMGDLPDGTFGVGIFRGGRVLNVNDIVYDRGQIDRAFTQRDLEDQRIDARVTDLDYHTYSTDETYTRAEINAAFSQRDSRISAAQSSANAANSAAAAAQSSANAANSTNSAQASAIAGLRETAQHLQNQIDAIRTREQK